MAILWHPSPTVAEHLAAIRSTPASNRGWRINGSVRTPSGITVPAAWLLEEFPELTEDPLPPFLEGCAESAAGMRWLEEDQQVGRLRGVFVALVNLASGLLTFGIVINVVSMALLRSPLLPFKTLIIGLLAVYALTWLLSIRRGGRRIPQKPGEMLLSKDKNFQQDFRLLPLGARDLLLGAGVSSFPQERGGSSLWCALELFFLYFWFMAAMHYLSEGHRGVMLFSFVLATTVDLVAQYNQGGGAATVWAAGESGAILQRILAERRRRVSQSFLPWWRQLHRSPRWGRRWVIRQWRMVRSNRSAVAVALWNWPLLTVLLGGWGALLFATIQGIGATAAIMVGLLFFVLARSPFVCRGERSTRYLARRHLQQYDRLIRFHRRWQQREEGKVVKG